MIEMMGWDEAPARFGARYLLDAASECALGATSVLVPGRRAGRLLRRELLEQGGQFLESPLVLTPSTLVETFFAPVDELVPASSVVAECAWHDALCSMDAAAEQLFPGMPEAPDVRESLARARRLRGVCDELDAIDMTPADIAARTEMVASERWNALEVLRGEAHGRLRAIGRIESTFMRARMIAHGTVRDDAPERLVVLAVSDPGPLTRATFDLLGARCRLLVDAPESEVEAFDRWGRPRPDAWNERDSVIADGEIELVDRPIEAAEQVLVDLAELHASSGPLVPGRVVIGVCDESTNPVLERAGRRAGVPVRAPVGPSREHGEVGTLLVALRDHLIDPTISSFSALLRMPAVESMLMLETAPTGEDTHDLLALLDRWRADRVGADLEDLRAGRLGSRDRFPIGVLREAFESLERMIAPIVAAGNVSEGIDSLLVFMQRCFASRTEGESLRGDLAAMVAALDPLRARPGAKLGDHGCAFLLELVITQLQRQHRTPEPDRGAIELLGWLEMRHEPAEDVILVGLNETGELSGRIADGWLPDSLRSELELPCEASRFARDVHAMHVLRARARSLRAIVLRHDLGGDPLTPSRLVLAGCGRQLGRRVLDLIEGTPRVTAAGALAGTPAAATEEGFPAPRPKGPLEIASLRVTDFSSWLHAPLDFWLERLEHLEDVDPSALELDALQFGSLAHTVLEVLEEGSNRESDDTRRIEQMLLDRLDALILARYGHAPAPAILMQQWTLAERLKSFAVVQARMVRSGWVIDELEYELDAPLEIPGQDPVRIRGRIDRIDRHEDGRIRLLDYKTSEKPVEIAKKRKKDGTWDDLQLPLYDHFLRMQRAIPEASIELGYVSLPTDPSKVGVEIGSGWTPQMLAEGVDQAREIVRMMRAADFESTKPPRAPGGWRGKLRPIDRILRTGALDIVTAGEDAGDDSDDEESAE